MEENIEEAVKGVKKVDKADEGQKIAEEADKNTQKLEKEAEAPVYFPTFMKDGSTYLTHLDILEQVNYQAMEKGFSVRLMGFNRNYSHGFGIVTLQCKHKGCGARVLFGRVGKLLKMWTPKTIKNTHNHNMTVVTTYEKQTPLLDMNSGKFEYPSYCSRIFSSPNAIREALYTEAMIRKLPTNMFRVVNVKKQSHVAATCKKCELSQRFDEVKVGSGYVRDKRQANHSHYPSSRKEKKGVQKEFYQSVQNELDRSKDYIFKLLDGFQCIATKAYSGALPSMMVMTTELMKKCYPEDKQVYYHQFDSFESVPTHYRIGIFWVPGEDRIPSRLTVLGISLVSNIRPKGLSTLSDMIKHAFLNLHSSLQIASLDMYRQVCDREVKFIEEWLGFLPKGVTLLALTHRLKNKNEISHSFEPIAKTEEKITSEVEREEELPEELMEKVAQKWAEELLEESMVMKQLEADESEESVQKEDNGKEWRESALPPNLLTAKRKNEEELMGQRFLQGPGERAIGDGGNSMNEQHDKGEQGEPAIPQGAQEKQPISESKELQKLELLRWSLAYFKPEPPNNRYLSKEGVDLQEEIFDYMKKQPKKKFKPPSPQQKTTIMTSDVAKKEKKSTPKHQEKDEEKGASGRGKKEKTPKKDPPTEKSPDPPKDKQSH